MQILFYALSGAITLGVLLALAALFSPLFSSREKRLTRLALGLIPAACLSLGLFWAMGYVNALVCVLNLEIIWLLVKLAARILRRRPGRPAVCALVALLLTGIYLSAGWVLAHRVTQTRYEIAGTGASAPLRIALFTDSHVGTTFDGAELSRYVAEIQAQNPDLVVIAGDFVDDSTSRQDMLAACAALKQLQAPYGVYFSFGNHDKGYYDNALRGYTGDDLIQELEKNGVTVLQDEYVPLGEDFYLVGRQDLSENLTDTPRATMGELMAQLPESDRYTIVLDHQPADFDAEAQAGAGLVLCGHTHGGQMIPINYLGQWLGVNDLRYGHERRQNTDFIVSSGISDWELLFKTGCHSEYVLIDLLP